jgi:hypothetical protein
MLLFIPPALGCFPDWTEFLYDSEPLSHSQLARIGALTSATSGGCNTIAQR